MNHYFRSVFMVFLPLFMALAAWTQPLTQSEKFALDSLYQEGEFGTGIDLSKSLLQNRHNLTQSDSAYALTYLSVMLAANPDHTAEAKNYMWKLLEVDPGAKISPLLPGERVYAIWERTKREKADISPTTAQQQGQELNTNSKKAGQSNWKWILGGAALAGTFGVVSYFALANNPDEGNDVVYKVDVPD